MKNRFLPLILGLVFALSACKKDDKEDEPGETAQPSSPQVNISGTSASLIAINTGTRVDVPILGPVTQFTGTAVAFFTNGNNNTPLDAGMVSCESQELVYQSGTYFYRPGTSNPEGLDFGSSVDWVVSGDGPVPAMTYTYNRSVPEIGSLTVDETVKISEGVTFGIDYSNSFTSLGTVDSVMYFIHGPSGSIHKTLPPSATDVTFSASDLQGVGTGYGYAQVAAYNYSVQTINGYQAAFVNEGVFTQQITLE